LRDDEAELSRAVSGIFQRQLSMNSRTGQLSQHASSQASWKIGNQDIALFEVPPRDDSAKRDEPLRVSGDKPTPSEMFTLGAMAYKRF
jgi:hypothetical protein